MKIDKTKLYDSYFKDERGEKFPMYKDDSNLRDALKNRRLTKHFSRACERTDEIVDVYGNRIGVTAQSWSNALVTAMVRSGDLDVHDAIIVVTDCCERCLNILEVKYLGAKVKCSSYFYDKWDRPCEFCEKEDDKYILPSDDGHSYESVIPTTNDIKG